jgi:hypothetical protein
MQCVNLLYDKPFKKKGWIWSTYDEGNTEIIQTKIKLTWQLLMFSNYGDEV